MLPIYIGYALTGIQLFGYFAPSFASLSIALSSLWALMAGDEVNATFRQVAPVWPVVGRLYVFSFIGIFYLAVANIFIVLVESSYMLALQQNYKNRGECSSKSGWSQLGVEFARYAQKILRLTETATGAPSNADAARRLAALEASMAKSRPSCSNACLLREALVRSEHQRQDQEVRRAPMASPSIEACLSVIYEFLCVRAERAEVGIEQS